MSVHQTKDGRWFVKYYPAGRHAGEKRKYFGRGHENEMDARKWDHARKTGRIKTSAVPTFFTVAQAYLDQHPLTPETRRTIMYALNKYAVFGEVPCDRLSMSGLAALLTLFSLIFIFIKWVGAAYLVWLGLSQIRSTFKASSGDTREEPAGNGFFTKGFIVAATNPKGLLFAGAFFPQFINQDAAVAPQIAVLCLVFFITAFLVELVYAYAADTTGRLFESERFKHWTGRVSGAFLVMFGVGLVFVKRNH